MWEVPPTYLLCVPRAYRVRTACVPRAYRANTALYSAAWQVENVIYFKDTSDANRADSQIESVCLAGKDGH
jgi:hypothetical protein